MRRKRKNRSEQSGEVSTGGAQFTTPQFSGGANRMGSVDGFTLGFANLTRHFEYDVSRNNIATRPPFFIRRVAPMACFVQGWSASELDGDNTDLDETLDVSVTPNTALYPITRQAQVYADTVWPQIDNLLKGGLGQRITTVSLSASVRYFAHVINTLSLLREAVMLNFLAYHFDWTKVYPYTNIVPKEILFWADALGLDDPGFGQFWIPRMRRLEGRILPPGLTMEVKDCLKPLTSISISPELWIPRVTMQTDLDTLLTDIDDSLNYIESDLDSVEAVLKSFLPFPVSTQMPWEMSDPVVDPLLWEGWINSGMTNYTTFGTGQPDTDSKIILKLTRDGTVYGSESGSCDWLTMHEYPLWAAVKHGSIFYGIGPDTWHVIASKHEWNNCGVVTDISGTSISDMITVFDGTGDIRDRDLAWFRELRFAGARDHDVIAGYHVPGYIKGKITSDAHMRLSELDVLADWSFEALQQLNTAILGRSLREVQQTILALVYGNV